MDNQLSQLDTSIFEHGTRRTAFLTGLETPGEAVVPEVQDLIDHRQRTLFSQTIGLQALMAQQQARAIQPGQPAMHSATAAATPPGIPVSQPPAQKVRHRRRVPVLQQMEMVECGAACLAMMLRY